MSVRISLGRLLIYYCQYFGTNGQLSVVKLRYDQFFKLATYRYFIIEIKTYNKGNVYLTGDILQPILPHICSLLFSKTTTALFTVL